MPFSAGIYTRTDGTRTGATVWQQADAADVPINAPDADTHDQDIANALSTCVLKDGTQIITADLPMNSHKLTGLSAGMSSGDSVRYEQIANSANLPAGAMMLYGGTTAPTGWLLCNGAAVSRTTYSALFAAIGTAFGVGDGSTTFNLPDMRQRFPIGVAASGTGSVLGGTGGAIDHTHSVPAHYHGMGTGADLNITASGAHIHNVQARPDDATSTGDYYISAEQTTQGVQDKPIDSATHIHAAGNFAGSIGLKTGGVDGNSPMTSGVQNPPFQAVNFIIKT